MSWNVQPRAFRALLTAFLWMDLRNETYGQATRSPAWSVVPPLYWVIGQFLATSLLASLLLFMRTDVWFFAFAGLGLNFLLLFSCLVVEFHEVVLDAADAEVIGHRPITQRTYAASRIANLGFYVALMTVANTIFPAIIGAALPDAPPLYLPLYVLSSVLVSIMTAALVILLYTALGAGGVLDQVRGLLAWVQIIAIMAVFYGGQLMLRNADGSVEHLAARPPTWIYGLPMAWLADGITGTVRDPFPSPLVAFAAVGLTTFLLLGIALPLVGRAWKRVCAGELRTLSAKVRGEALAGTTKRGFIANRRAAAIYWLVRTMFARDQELSLRCWPAFGLAAAALVLGIATDQLASPVITSGPNVVLTLAVLVLLAGAVPALYQNLRFSRDHEASWLIESAPPGSMRDVSSGVRWALRRTFFLPVSIVLAAVLAYVWRSPIEVLVQVATAWLMMEGAASICKVELPFTHAPARGAASQFTPASIAAGAMAALFGGFQYAFAGALLPQLILCASLFGVLILRRRSG